MIEKYGFVYIWFDRKHKRFYIGSHWGYENDRYICSSRWMRKAYRRRQQDFRRKILSRIFTNRKETFDKEQEWLNKIKDKELGKRYYNLCKFSKNHWSTNEEKRLSIAEQTRQRCLGKPLSKEHVEKIIKTRKEKYPSHSEETKQKISDKLKGRILNENQINAIKINAEKLRGKPAYNRGVKVSEEQAEANRNRTKGMKWINNGIECRFLRKEESIPEDWKFGNLNTINGKTKGMIYITDGKINKRINQTDIIPEGWRKGRTTSWSTRKK